MQRRPMLIAIALLSLLTWVGAANAQFTEDSTFDSNGVEIRYVVQGAGEPVILIHGFSASIEANWQMPGILGALAQEFKVIALDARGHGKSGKPHDPSAYGLEMVEDVVRLMDHLEIPQAHIVGYSMGGFITLKMLTLHPERFLSASLGGAGFSPPDQNGPIATLADSLEAGEGFGPLILALTPVGAPPPSAEMIEMTNQMLLMSNDPLALAAAIRGMDRIAVSEQEASSITVPVQAIIGEIDPLRAGVEELQRLLPTLEVTVLAGRDHMTAISDPQLTASLRGFYIQLCKCA